MTAKRKIILVTGSDGFIGSHLVEELVRKGHTVKAFVLYNSFNSWGWLDYCDPSIRNNFEVFPGDVRDAACVKQAMRGCEMVLHLAALISIPYSYVAPESFVDTNVKGTLNVLQAAKELDLEKVIHTSTSEVYGTALTVPITEEHPLRAQSPYSASKIAADQMAMSFFYSFGTPVSIVRPFNTYGPRQSTRAVIPTIITQLAGGTGSIKLGILDSTRDFVYVKDTVNGFVAVAESEASIGRVINIGSNFEVSIKETAAIIAGLMNKKFSIEVEHARLRPDTSEVERLWADNKKAIQILNWKPLYGGREGFKKGLAETIAWFNNPANLQRYRVGAYNI